MYFVDLSNSDICDRRVDMTIDLNCTLLEDAIANATKLKDKLNAPSARVFTYIEPEHYDAVEVVVVVKNGITRYRASSINARMLQHITEHQAKDETVMPFKYFLALV